MFSFWPASGLYIDPESRQDEVAAVAAGADSLGLSHMEIISGAGHDACNIARVAPASMIFVPCADGISHAEIESATLDDCAAGCEVLLNAVMDKADDG